MATRGMALQGEAEEGRQHCHTATDVDFRDGHHWAAQHGQEGSASVSCRDVRINGNLTGDTVPLQQERAMFLMQGYPSQNNFLVKREPASFLSC